MCTIFAIDGNYRFLTSWKLSNICNTYYICMSLNNANSSKQFAADHQNLLLLEKSRICEKLESIHEVVNTKISVYCKFCANFYGSIANFFWHRISDHFYWSKEHLHQVWKLYPKMHYFAIFEGLQTLLKGYLSEKPISVSDYTGPSPIIWA